MRTLMYIDPGTGSMLFTVLIGVVTAGIWLFRRAWLKIRFVLSGGKREKTNEGHVPFAIFTDDKRYWTLFRPICEEMDRRGETVAYLTASPDDPALKESFEHVKTEFIGEGNRAYAHMGMLDADIVLSTTPGLDVYQWKRSRTVGKYVHIPHMVNDLTRYRMFGLDYYDAVLLTGEYQGEAVRKLEKLRGLPEKELAVVGLPYLDEMQKRLEREGPAPEHPVTVLLSPTWGPSGIFSRYGGEVIEALLKTPYQIIVRPHPQSFTSEKELMSTLMAKYPDSDRLRWDRSNDNFEVLRKSDVMISDFSGVTMDFALVFGRPVICVDTEFDKAVYDAWWLDDELWIMKTLDRIGLKLTRENVGDIGNMIARVLEEPAFREAIETARQECWANIGHSAEKTADWLIDARRRLQEDRTEVKTA